MKLIALELLIASARPLPWPVNARVEELGALSFGQLEATRILRRHAANQLPGLVKVLRLAINRIDDDAMGRELIEKIQTAIAAAETVRVES